MCVSIWTFVPKVYNIHQFHKEVYDPPKKLRVIISLYWKQNTEVKLAFMCVINTIPDLNVVDKQRTNLSEERIAFYFLLTRMRA